MHNEKVMVSPVLHILENSLQFYPAKFVSIIFLSELKKEDTEKRYHNNKVFKQ